MQSNIPKTIENFIEDNFYNQIFYAIKKYAYENRIYLRSESIKFSTHQELSDIKVSKVYFKNDFSSKLSEFNVTTIATFLIEGKRGGDIEEDEVDKTFILTMSGDLENKLSNSKVLKVEEAITKGYTNYKDVLSGCMLPYLKNEELDDEATKFLNKYCPEALANPMPLPIDKLLKNMQITKYDAPLAIAFGEAYFDKHTTDVYDDKKNKKTIEVDKKTILVDPDVQFLRSFGSYNFTVVHECVHIEYHYKYFQLRKILDPTLSYITCLDVKEPDALKTDDLDARNLMEWQANALAPRILMPKNTFLRKYHELYSQVLADNKQMLAGDVMSVVIEKLADFYQVSRLAVKIRLIDLGIDTAAGTHNYINNKHYQNFSFKEKSLKKDQTYLIDFLNYVVESKKNPQLEKLSYEKKIVYVDGLVVINDPKYVHKDDDKTNKLTDYALEHVDECAFVFDREIVNPEDKKDYIYSTCYLCHADTGLEVKSKYNTGTANNKEKEEIANQQKNDNEDRQYWLTFMKGMPNGNFQEIFMYMVEKLEDGAYWNVNVPNIHQICKATHIHHEAIENFIDGKSKLTKESVLRCCCGFCLYPDVAFYVLAKAGYDITNTQDIEDWTFMTLIREHYDDGFEYWNPYLESANMKKL